jgi:hypothetical protein
MSLLTELNKAQNRWAGTTQPQMIEANITALGSTSTSYTVTLKNGSKISNIEGPSGLSVGNAVVLASYPGANRRHVILGKSGGGKTNTIKTVRV